MTVEDILETDTAYIIILNNPNAKFLPKNSVGAVELIKLELDGPPIEALQRSKGQLRLLIERSGGEAK